MAYPVVLACIPNEVADLIDEEVRRARATFPNNDVMLAALTEEVGELAQALLQCDESDVASRLVHNEAIQVAAMAIRVLTEGDSSFPKFKPF